MRNTTASDFFLVQIVSGSSATREPRNGLFLGRVYGELGTRAPRTSLELDVVLPPGAYFFRCLDHNGSIEVSRVESVHGGPVSSCTSRTSRGSS